MKPSNPQTTCTNSGFAVTTPLLSFCSILWLFIAMISAPIPSYGGSGSGSGSGSSDDTTPPSCNPHHSSGSGSSDDFKFNSKHWTLYGNYIFDTCHFIGSLNNQHLAFRTNNQQRMVIKNNGFVGIGETNPLFRLQIDGRIVPSLDLTYDLGTPDLRFNNAYVGNISLFNATPGSVVFIDDQGFLGEDNGEFFWNSADARLGIGTSSPGEKLDVDGNVRASGVLNSANSIFINGVGGADKITAASGTINFDDEHLITTGNVGIGSANPQAAVEIKSANVQEAIIIGTGQPETANRHNAITFTEPNSNAGDNCIRWLDGSGNFVSGISGTVGGTGELTLGTATGAGFVTFRSGSNQERVRITQSGDIGIGTTDPEGAVHIAPTNQNEAIVIGTGTPETTARKNSITFTEANASSGDNGIRWLDGSGNSCGAIFGTAGGNTELRLATTVNTGYLTFHSGRSRERMRITADGNVGIGTDSPSEKLVVDGNIRSLGTLASGNSIVIDGVNDQITASSGKIDFEDEDLVTQGNVGIGIIAPTEKLAVDGNISTTGSLSSNGSLVLDGVNDKITASSGILDFDDEDLITTGKIGIGISAPAEKLDIDGNMKATGTLTSGNSITVDGVNDKITASSGTIDFDNENLITFGKIGIGIANPPTALAVNGDITISGDLQSANSQVTNQISVGSGPNPFTLTGATSPGSCDHIFSSGNGIVLGGNPTGSIANIQIGVGILVPDEKLHMVEEVDGEDIKIELNADNSGGTTQKGFVGFDPDENFVFLENAGGTRAGLDPNGQFGVNTTTPTKKLEVCEPGDVQLRLSSTTDHLTRTDFETTANGDLAIFPEKNGLARNVGIGMASPTQRFHVDGNVCATDSVLAKALDILELIKAGELDITGDAQIGGRLEIGPNTMTLASDTVLSATGTGIQTDVILSSDRITIGNEDASKLDTIQVGIGTDNAHFRLRIGKGVRWTDQGWDGALELDNNAAIGWHPKTSGGNAFGIGQREDGLHIFSADDAPGSSSNPLNYPMFIDRDGNVGIGGGASVYDPVYKLDVNGRIRAKVGNVSTFAVQAMNKDAARVVDIGTNNDQGMIEVFHEDSTNASVRLLAVPGENMWFNNGGRVGVGTNNPKDRLEINSGIPGKSGLRFTHLNSETSTDIDTVADYDLDKVLTVDSTGEVILLNLGSSHVSSKTNNTKLLEEELAKTRATLDEVMKRLSILELCYTELCQTQGHTTLDQNFPNPFNGTTTITYNLVKPGKTELSIYNAFGTLINTLVNEYQEEGSHSIFWDADGLPPGVYLYKLNQDGEEIVKKAIHIR